MEKDPGGFGNEGEGRFREILSCPPPKCVLPLKCPPPSQIPRPGVATGIVIEKSFNSYPHLDRVLEALAYSLPYSRLGE